MNEWILLLHGRILKEEILIDSFSRFLVGSFSPFFPLSSHSAQYFYFYHLLSGAARTSKQLRSFLFFRLSPVALIADGINPACCNSSRRRWNLLGWLAGRLAMSARTLLSKLFARRIFYIFQNVERKRLFIIINSSFIECLPSPN